MTRQRCRGKVKLIFAGTPANAALALATLAARHEIVLAITREDSAQGRKQEMTPSPVAVRAAALGIPILKRNRLTSADCEVIQDSGADRAIVVAYGAMIPQSLLDQLPWWNLHFSLLPLWRGATPLQHSMLSGGKGAGITLFELEAGLDTGPILASEAKEIDFSQSCGELLETFTRDGSELILEALGEQPTALAQTGEVSLAPKISRSQAKLDPFDTADRLAWKVMALNPEPMAWVELDELPLRILRATSLGNTNWVGIDGVSESVGRVNLVGGRVVMNCGSGTKLELKEVQPAGKKIMPAADWFRGLNREIQFE